MNGGSAVEHEFKYQPTVTSYGKINVQEKLTGLIRFNIYSNSIYVLFNCISWSSLGTLSFPFFSFNINMFLSSCGSISIACLLKMDPFCIGVFVNLIRSLKLFIISRKGYRSKHQHMEFFTAAN